MSRPITLLTDYGLADPFAGVLDAVVARIAPESRVIHLTHSIARHDVLGGALTLADALPYAPAGVHVAVVDPQVGSQRRAVALLAAQDERILVGPDNGLLMLAADGLGGVVEAVDIGRSPWRLEPVSATFHGRDVFAPVAAHLAAGAPLAEAGEPIDPALLTGLEVPHPRPHGDGLAAVVIATDGYGNATLAVTHEQLAGTGLRLGRAVELRVGGAGHAATFAHTFADVEPGSLLLYEDASRRLAVAVNRGDAAGRLGLATGDEVVVVPA